MKKNEFLFREIGKLADEDIADIFSDCANFTAEYTEDELTVSGTEVVERRFDFGRPYYKLINTFGKRAACVVCAVLAVSSVTVFSVDALRNRVSELFVDKHSTYSNIQFDNKGNAPETIETIYEIGYDLSDFSIDYERYTEYSRHILYSKDDISIDFVQYTKDMYDENVNSEGAEILTININGYDAIYFRDNHDYDFIIWDNEEYIFRLHSNIGKDKLMEIAESVHKAE